MQDTPDIDAIGMLHVEHQVGIAGQWPGTKARQTQLMGVAWRTGGRMTANVRVGLLQRINESEGRVFGIFGQVVRYGVFDVPVGLFARNNEPRLHLRAPALAAFRARLRKRSK